MVTSLLQCWWHLHNVVNCFLIRFFIVWTWLLSSNVYLFSRYRFSSFISGKFHIFDHLWSGARFKMLCDPFGDVWSIYSMATVLTVCHCRYWSPLILDVWECVEFILVFCWYFASALSFLSSNVKFRIIFSLLFFNYGKCRSTAFLILSVLLSSYVQSGISLGVLCKNLMSCHLENCRTEVSFGVLNSGCNFFVWRNFLYNRVGIMHNVIPALFRILSPSLMGMQNIDIWCYYYSYSYILLIFINRS